MLNAVKIISSEIDSKVRRVIKFLRLGKYDVQTSFQVAPYGVDSNPIKDMVAIYGPTGEKGKTVIIGYINKNQVAAPGEYRTFSTDADGELKFYIHQKANGTCEIGGSSHNLVRYTPLNSALQTELGIIAAAINAIVPGSYSPTLDITASKINEIKTL